jgi:glycosyltransferase involved in cell wall biosynthesis
MIKTKQMGRLRVLQVIENLNNRAVETWLLRVFRQAVSEYAWIDWSFFCVLPEPGKFDDEVRSAGGEVIHSLHEIGDKRRFLLSLREVMKRERYDILHCHHDIMSAVYLAAAAGLPFRKRIVHVHNTSLSLPTPNKVKADLVRAPMKQMCLRMADQIVGISRDALDSLVGKRVAEPGRHTVVHYAVDTARFAQGAEKTAQWRRELGREFGLAPAAKILLFVGRLVEYKNPEFLIEILKHVLKVEPDAVALFAGAGPLEATLHEVARKNTFQDRVRLLGFRDDVPQLMLASDVLIWPSLEDPKEGLGLGIIEAQAAGLPIVMSRSVPDEAVVVPQLVKVLPLAAGAGAWGDAALQLLHGAHPSRQESLRRVEASSFSMAQGVRNMMALYDL